MTSKPELPRQDRPESFAPPARETDDADLFDYAKLRDYLGFVLHASIRRWMAVAAITVITVLDVVLLIAVLPSTYHCEVKIQAQRNQVISAVAGMSHPWDYEVPTHAAADLVLRYDNLRLLARKTNLVREWDATRAPILHLKDQIVRRLWGEPSDEIKERMLIGTLEQRLTVQVTEDTVVIAIDWPDARSAYRLIQAAHESFLEAREYREVSTVAEAIALLESRAEDARQEVNVALDRVQKLRAGRPRQCEASVKAALPARPARVDPDMQRLRTQLQAKKRLIVEIEEFRKRRIAELASRLADLRQVYSDFHPAVVDLQQTLEQQRHEENSQLAVLRQEYRQLEDQYERHGGPALESAEHATSAPLPAEAIQIGRSTEEESPEVESAKADLKHEIGRYSSLGERVEQARLEMESQRAAFGYRYSVLRPPALPEKPAKPNKKLMIGGGLLIGFFLGVLVAVLADLRSRCVLERWQIERQLGLAVLAEVPPP